MRRSYFLKSLIGKSENNLLTEYKYYKREVAMKKLSNFYLFFFLAGALIFTTSCKKDGSSNPDFGIFSSQDANTAIMNGLIGSNTPKQWDDFIKAFPNTNRIIMKECPGSEDDASNLQVARKVRGQNVAIHLPSDAAIASGAVDFYLAGTTRTREAGSRIGVHSWSDGTNEATAFPVGHANHQSYIDYYVEMGFSQADAAAFYYFTINAAAAADIHWMTDSEIERYKLLTQ